MFFRGAPVLPLKEFKQFRTGSIVSFAKMTATYAHKTGASLSVTELQRTPLNLGRHLAN